MLQVRRLAYLRGAGTGEKPFGTFLGDNPEGKLMSSLRYYKNLELKGLFC